MITFETVACRFVAEDADIITSQLDGCGRGFVHVGLKAAAEKLAKDVGIPLQGWSTTNVYSGTLKAWDGVSPKLLGWVVTIDRAVRVE